MKTSHLWARLPWAALLVVGCDGGGSGAGGTDSGPGTSTSSGSLTTAAPDTSTGASSSSTSTEGGSSTQGVGTSVGSESGGSSSESTTTANDGLVAVDDMLFAQQSQPLSVDAAQGVLENDSPPNDETITVTAFDAMSTLGGTVAVGADGTVDYEPVEGFWGIDSFTYTVADEGGEEATATVTVHVAPALIPLSEVAAGAGGFSVDGDAGDRLGFSVSDAGDVNGDGRGDIVLSQYWDDVMGPATGGAYVVFGKADTDAVPLAAVTGGVGGFALESETLNDGLGHSVSGAGDVNGDGLDDVIVGAFSSDASGPATGRSYVVFGKVDTGSVSLSEVAGAGMGGFALDGESGGYLSGASVSGAGDVNADGLADILVSANRPFGVSAFPGRCYVVLGTAQTDTVQLSDVVSGTGGYALDGETEGSNQGPLVSDAGDVNGDGLADIIVSSRRHDANGTRSGRSYVVFATADMDTLKLSDVANGIGGFALDGEAALDSSGSSVSSAGDINGDGLADLVVGAPNADPNGQSSGRSYVVFGKADTDAVPLSDVAGGMGGFALDGEAEHDNAGSSVSGAGDVNGDGVADIIIGAPGNASNGQGSGRSYVVFGKADTVAVQLSDVASGVGGFALEGEYGFSGSSVSGAGDINGDGLADVVVGAPWNDAHGLNSGRAYVVFGVRTTNRP